MFIKSDDVDKFLLSSNLNLNTKSVNDADAWLPFIAFGAAVWLLNADSVSGALKYLISCKEPVNSTPKSPNEPVEPKNTSPLAVHCPFCKDEVNPVEAVEPLKVIEVDES